ncbi:MAG: phosphatase PAP2 family protein [Candidatus Hydrogenedentes bacterium]|nr:phosphatase PAP2 family protein [Candidatus Hydrogenedentota bacterium]
MSREVRGEIRTSVAGRRWSRWIRGRQDLLILVLFLMPVLGTWAFIELADEVVEGETQRIDEHVLRLLRNPEEPADPLGPPWFEEIGRDLSALGGVAVLTLVTVFVAGFLAMRRRWGALFFLLGSTLSGLALSTVLKYFFDRPRPDVVPHLSHAALASFPSGHSMLSAIVYLALGTLLARLVLELRLKLYILGMALTLTFLVGASRVYAGVHYPSDVLAGWTAGLVWAMLCWLAARYLQERGSVEKPD